MLSGLGHGIEQLVTPLLQEMDIVHEDDRIVHHDPHEHDHSHEGDEPQAHAGEVKGIDHPGKGKGDGEHDDERVPQVLKQCGHDHVNQEDPQDEQGRQLAEGLLLLLHVAAETHGNPVGKPHALKGLSDLFGGVAEGAPEQIRLHAYDLLPVLALDLNGTLPFHNPGQVAQPDLPSVGGEDRGVEQVLETILVGLVKSGEDVVAVRCVLVFGGILSVKIVSESPRDGSDVQPQGRGLLPVHIHPELGPRVLLGHSHVHQPRHLVEDVPELSGEGDVFVQIRALDLDGDRFIAPHERHGDRVLRAHADLADPRDLLHLLSQGRSDLIGAPLSLCLGCHLEKEVPHVRPFIKAQGYADPPLGLPAEGIGMQKLFGTNHIVNIMKDLLDDLCALFDPGPLGKPEVDAQVPGVGLGHEGGGEERNEREPAHKKADG